MMPFSHRAAPDARPDTAAEQVPSRRGTLMKRIGAANSSLVTTAVATTFLMMVTAVSLRPESSSPVDKPSFAALGLRGPLPTLAN